MDALGPQDPRLLHVERGLEAMDRDLRDLQRQVIVLGQRIWQEWSDIGSIGVPMTSVPVCISGGPVSGCSGVLSGRTVTVTNDAINAVTGTGNTDGSGNFSVTIMISGSVNGDISVSGTGWVMSTNNTTITAGGSFSTGSVSLTPVSGYDCNNTIPGALTVVDLLFGRFSPTYSGLVRSSHTWSTGTVTASYAGHGSCAARASFPISLTHPNATVECDEASSSIAGPRAFTAR